MQAKFVLINDMNAYLLNSLCFTDSKISEYELGIP